MIQFFSLFSAFICVREYGIQLTNLSIYKKNIGSRMKKYARIFPWFSAMVGHNHSQDKFLKSVCHRPYSFMSSLFCLTVP